MTEEIVKYEANGQEIELSANIIREYLISGDKDNITDKEIMMFLSLCRFQGLNPWLREAYLIKYGGNPATIVTGKETFLKRAVRDKRYAGHKTGMSDDEKTAWAEVYIHGYAVPIRCEVTWEEYVGRKKDGTITKMWKEKPRTMLKKVALVQALREAFPDVLGGMYSQEEINTIEGDKLPTEPVARPSDSLGDIIDEKNVTDAELVEDDGTARGTDDGTLMRPPDRDRQQPKDDPPPRFQQPPTCSPPETVPPESFDKTDVEKTWAVIDSVRADKTREQMAKELSEFTGTVKGEKVPVFTEDLLVTNHGGIVSKKWLGKIRKDGRNLKDDNAELPF